MTGLAADFRARSVNDLVTVQVIESIVGTGTADSNLTRRARHRIGDEPVRPRIESVVAGSNESDEHDQRHRV